MRRALSALIVCFSCLTSIGVLSAREYLYLPQAVEEGQPVVGDGVLVREVLVKKRDNLAKIAKRYTGHDDYYPQILLFNTIKNPRLIHPGDLLRVPVTKRSPKAATPVAAQRSAVAKAAAAATTPTPLAARPTAPADDNEQAQYARALATARQGACQQAVEQFDGFLSRYPRSPMASDALLHRADCLLRLSAGR